MVIKNLKLELLNVKSCSSKSNILRLDENESIKTPINVQNVNEADATKCITNSTFPGHFSKHQRSNLNQFVQWLHETASQWTDVISCRGVTGSARLRAAASRRRKKGGSGSVSASAAAMRTRARTHTLLLQTSGAVVEQVPSPRQVGQTSVLLLYRRFTRLDVVYA